MNRADASACVWRSGYEHFKAHSTCCKLQSEAFFVHSWGHRILRKRNICIIMIDMSMGAEVLSEQSINIDF